MKSRIPKGCGFFYWASLRILKYTVIMGELRRYRQRAKLVHALRVRAILCKSRHNTRHES